jgi:hypothetical protein
MAPKHKGGRPKTDHPKLQVPIRMSQEEKDRFTEAATRQGQELAPWVRLHLHAAANKVLG